MKHSALLSSLALVGVMAAVPAYAQAGTSRTGFIQSVPDPKLATLRGKFVSSRGPVAYFGIRMFSSWDSAVGRIEAQTLVGLRSGQEAGVVIEPTISVAVTEPVTQTQNAAWQDDTDHSASQGIRQQVQVAGHRNRAGNTLVVGTSDVPTPQEGAPSMRTYSASGVQVTAGLMSGQGVGLSIEAGSTRLLQRVSGGRLAEQLVQVAGNGQQAQNLMSIQLRPDTRWQRDHATVQAMRRAVLNAAGL